MFDLFATILRILFSGFQSRDQLLLENLALRHPLIVRQRSVPKPNLKRADRFLWVRRRRCWSGWPRVLVIVEPCTVVAGHPVGFRCFWRWKSRRGAGRPAVNRDLIGLIRRLGQAHPTWGRRRIQAEWAPLRFSRANCRTNFSAVGSVVARPTEDRFLEPSDFCATSFRCHVRMVSGRTICATSVRAFLPRRLPISARLIRSGPSAAVGP